jgi:alpha-galactosidase
VRNQFALNQRFARTGLYPQGAHPLGCFCTGWTLLETSRLRHQVSAAILVTLPKVERSVVAEKATSFQAIAVRTGTEHTFPTAAQWEAAIPIHFHADWQGQNPDPQRATTVRLLWTPQTLFIRFLARYREITVFPDSEPSGRRDKLWDRDVVETFLQPDASNIWRYKEFEVSPNGMWIDLDVSHRALSNPHSGLRRRVTVDASGKTWHAELALPMESLVAEFDSAATWRANFFRIEGAEEPRFYSAWSPTNTAVPNFHVPEAFGTLIFRAT